VPLLWEVFTAPEVHAALQCLLGDGYLWHPHRRPHHNDPGSGAQTLHKDSHYGFQFHRSHVPWWVMAMYYPQDTSSDMAPTSVCPSTQFYAGEEHFDARHADDASSVVDQWQSREVNLVCKAGTVVLLHNDIWHRGTANVSQTRRWMFCFMFLRVLPPPCSPTLPYQPAPGYVSLLALLASDTDKGQAERDNDNVGFVSRVPLFQFVASWLHGCPVPRPRDVNVSEERRLMDAASNDQTRLAAAYRLAHADDTAGATAALVDVMANASSEALRRAAKFGAVIACWQQLQGMDDCNEVPMINALISLARRSAPIAACAARALGEHGAWACSSSSLRERVATQIAHALKEGSAGPSRPPARSQEQDAFRKRPNGVGVGAAHGVVSKWFRDRGYGFIRPSQTGTGAISTSNGRFGPQESSCRQETIWCGASAAGGGELLPGHEVWFDVQEDPRTQRLQAIRVSGPGVFALGGRTVGVRNAHASLVEALAAVPCSADEPSAYIAADVLRAELSLARLEVGALVDDPSKQAAGECLHAAALGSVRLVSRLGFAQVCRAPWWHSLRSSLVALVAGAAIARHTSGALKCRGRSVLQRRSRTFSFECRWSSQSRFRRYTWCRQRSALLTAVRLGDAAEGKGYGCSPASVGGIARHCILCSNGKGALFEKVPPDK